MRFPRIVWFALFLFVLGIALAGPARADRWNKKTIVTFKQPVEVPGNVVLPAGKYVFRLNDSKADRHIVQIWNGDGTKLLTTILAVPNYRWKPTYETVIEFHERPGTQPQAIRAWFFPGDNFGEEFAYPKARAVMLAEASNEVVPAEIAETAPAPEELESVPLVAVTPTQKEEPIEQAIQIAPGPEKTAPTPTILAETKLPKTAGPIPLIGLIGLIFLGLGFGLRLLARQKS